MSMTVISCLHITGRIQCTIYDTTKYSFCVSLQNILSNIDHVLPLNTPNLCRLWLFSCIWCRNKYHEMSYTSNDNKAARAFGKDRHGVFLDERRVLNCIFFSLASIDFTFAWKNLSCVFGFPLCGQHKGVSGMGCGNRECAVCLSACLGVCFTALVTGWCQWIHINSAAHPCSPSYFS